MSITSKTQIQVVKLNDPVVIHVLADAKFNVTIIKVHVSSIL